MKPIKPYPGYRGKKPVRRVRDSLSDLHDAYNAAYNQNLNSLLAPVNSQWRGFNAALLNRYGQARSELELETATQISHVLDRSHRQAPEARSPSAAPSAASDGQTLLARTLLKIRRISLRLAFSERPSREEVGSAERQRASTRAGSPGKQQVSPPLFGGDL